LQEKKIVNIPDKGKVSYQSFLEDITRNSLITSKDNTPFSIPSHPNYDVSEEKRRINFTKPQNSKNKNEPEESKSKDTMEIFNFDDKNAKTNNNNENSHVIHQITSQDNANLNPEPEGIQPPPFTFKETTNPKILIQTPKGLYRNATPFIISSARLPETQKILNSFRNEPGFDLNNVELKNSAASNKTGTTCLICFDKIPDAVFMECGHGGFLYFLFGFNIFEISIHIFKEYATIVLWNCGNLLENVTYAEM